MPQPIPFGQLPDGRRTSLFSLCSDRLKVGLTDYGGRLVSLEAPDRNGRFDHVALGFDRVEDYLAWGGSFGALLGRTANRIGGGCFTLEGREFTLDRNDGPNTLHGGAKGFGKRLWTIAEFSETHVSFHLRSDDGDQGYPGAVEIDATYRLEEDVLRLSFAASTSAPTPLTLSAHPYFNLSGLPSGSILDHEIALFADHFLPTDKTQVPTGEIRKVADTPFDFRHTKPAGKDILIDDPQLLTGKGYDHYFVLTTSPDQQERLALRATCPASGRALEISTSHPGGQFYTGNVLTGVFAGRGGIYRQSAGFAFEPHGFPDAPNHPNFPTTILRPGDRYEASIVYRFSTS